MLDRNVSITALRPRTKDLIFTCLNPCMVLRATSSGHLRDWRGLFTLCDLSPALQDSVSVDGNPTKRILELWYHNDPKGSTIARFLLILEELERFDVIDDVVDVIDDDIEVYRSQCFATTAPSLEGDQYTLTTHDVLSVKERRPLIIYDACMLFVDDDAEFALQLGRTMEKRYGLRFCIPELHLLPGERTELDAMITLIVQRCRRIVVILSNAFLRSHIKIYYARLGQMFGIENRIRKMIPCLYNDCTLPADLRHISKLDFRQKLYDPYRKLHLSLLSPGV